MIAEHFRADMDVEEAMDVAAELLDGCATDALREYRSVLAEVGADAEFIERELQARRAELRVLRAEALERLRALAVDMANRKPN
jgi:hypothetical protein